MNDRWVYWSCSSCCTRLLWWRYTREGKRMKNIDLYIGSGGGGRQKSSRWNKNLPGRRTNSREKWGKIVCFFYPDSRQVTRVLSWFFFSVFMLHTRDGGKESKSRREGVKMQGNDNDDDCLILLLFSPVLLLFYVQMFLDEKKMWNESRTKKLIKLKKKWFKNKQKWLMLWFTNCFVSWLPGHR